MMLIVDIKIKILRRMNIMKKLIVLVLAMVMMVTLVDCGGNNDENNATVQAKIDEADGLLQEIYNYYNDNGLLVEGSADQTDMNNLLLNMEELKATNKKIIEDDGYSDEETATMVTAMDEDIASYTGIIDGYSK